MKRIIAILMCLTMLVLALVSCGGEDNLNPEAERPNLTLRMAIVVDDKTTDEGIAAMQAAFNAQCEVLLTTHIEFECIKASEYKERMNEIMSETWDALRNGNGNTALEDAKAEAGMGGTVVEEDEYAFPAATKGQFDILLIADREMYEEYVQNGWIISLNGHFSETFKPLNTKIIATAKDASLINGGCYGVPANKAYGEYAYLKINKEAADLYNISPDDIHSFSDAYGIITAMQIASGGNGLSKWEEMYGEDFSVIRNTSETFVNPNIKYLSQNGVDVSLLGATYTYNSTINAVGNLRNLLKDEEYTRYLEMLYVAEKEDYFGTGSEENFLIELVEGDYALRNSDDDYYFCPVSLPVMESNAIFGGMLAVSSFTVDQKRSLEIVQDLMTNATRANLLNILLYGDAQTNYSMEDGCVTYRKNSNYGVHPDYVFGNMRELAYPCTDFGQDADYYANATLQINQMGKRTPLFDETFSRYFENVDTEKWATVDTLSAQVYSRLMSSTDLATFRKNVGVLADELDSDANFSALLDNDSIQNAIMTRASLGSAFMRYCYNKTNGITLN